jgi:hypothetical protein
MWMQNVLGKAVGSIFLSLPMVKDKLGIRGILHPNQLQELNLTNKLLILLLKNVPPYIDGYMDEL